MNLHSMQPSLLWQQGGCATSKYPPSLKSPTEHSRDRLQNPRFLLLKTSNPKLYHVLEGNILMILMFL